MSLKLTHVVLNEAAGGSFSDTGPNDAPASGRGTRSCPSYTDQRITGHGPGTNGRVDATGIEVALQRFSQWVGAHAPEAGLWHRS